MKNAKFLAVQFLLAALASSNAWCISVRLQPSSSPPVSIGTVIMLNSEVTDAGPGTIWHRYRIQTPDGSGFRMVRDFSPEPSFLWTPMNTEGSYQIEITVKNRSTGETTSSITSFDVASRVSNGTPVITPTGNELVFLYSAPPCPAGNSFRVSFADPQGRAQSTPPLTCSGDKSMNVYLAGMRPMTEYSVQHTVRAADNTPEPGPQLTLRTGELSFTPEATYKIQRTQAGTEQDVLLQNRLFSYSLATDLEGNVIWYIPQIVQYLTRTLPGGFFLALFEDQEAGDEQQIIRKIDLAGNTVLETNAARINEQLDELGMNHVTSFHHEARSLPGGKIMVLAGTERLLTDVQGPGEIDVIGDMILVLNRNLEIEWVWDAFDHMDVTRKALLDEKCVPGGGGCPVFRLAPVANDWLHGNSLDMTADGNIIYSARHQDWVVKIDYANGEGTGDVLWRLGKDGDFRFLSSDPSPWFSHQHDPNLFEDGNNHQMVIFDNGNTRYATNLAAHSRGQVLAFNEESMTVLFVMNADLGDFSRALGSAQQLRNGNFHFNLGWMTNNFSQAVEVDGLGNSVSQIQIETQQYRSFRMRTLYNQ